jgi:hypothetical protein
MSADYYDDSAFRGSFPSAGSTFFADMTLDLHEAQMETTPRTESKFASMAASSSSTQVVSKEELIKCVPAMPLIEEPSFDNDDENEGSGGGDFTTKNDQKGTVVAATLSPVAEEDERVFTRITSGGIARDSSGGYFDDYIDYTNNYYNTGRQQRRNHHHTATNGPRPYPRDLTWTTAFTILIPVGLLLPHFYYSNRYIEHHNECEFLPDNCTPVHPSLSQMALSTSTHSTILFSTFVATIVSFGLLQLLYLHPGGGDGDDIRHRNVTRTLLLSANLSVWINPMLAFMIWFWLPNSRNAIVLPLGAMVRDVWWRAKKTGSALPSFRRRQRQQQEQQRSGSSSRGGAGTSASSSHDRKTFFRALACAALDILSRSLRHKSFVRVASILLVLQFVIVSIWWGALSVVLSVEIFKEDGLFTKFMHRVWLLATLVAGKWATGTVARLLGFVSSGGVASWFARQTLLIEEMRARQQQQRQQQETIVAEAARIEDQNKDSGVEGADDGDATTSNYKANYAAALDARHAMPEAYRTVDASVYSSPINFDDGLDDDYYDDDDFETPSLTVGGGGGSSSTSHHQTTSTVKSFLTAGCTFSFGSVAQCGLVGGLAQILWSIVRNIDAAGFFLQRQFSTSTMRRMDVSVNVVGGGGLPLNARQWKQTLAYWWRRLDVAIRAFVRGHSDLAMSHVAAYHKTYQRAANDVAALIETSGVESIIHDDITTQMCSALGHVLSGSIAAFFGTLLVTHRNTFATEPLSDYSLFEILLVSYFLCYSITFTALEPLRAAIKAVYICFAEHPLSLSQAFPLIFQRLSRISEASSNVV